MKSRRPLTLTLKTVIAIFCLLLTLFTLIFFLLTVGSAISPLLSRQTSSGTENLFHIILYTFEQSLASTFLALIVGTTASVFASNRRFPFRSFLLSLSSVPLCIPPLIIALGYIGTFGMNGFINRLLMKLLSLKEPPLTFLYTFWGIVITQGFYNAPLAMQTVSDSWMTLTRKEEEAASLLGADKKRIFLTITLPKLLPSMMSSAIIVFLFCFFSFMIVLLFGTPGGTTLEVAIYHAGRSSLNAKDGALLSLIETICALIIVLLYSAIEQKGSRTRGTAFTSPHTPSKKLSAKESFPFLIFSIIIFIFLIMPLLSICLSAFSETKGGESALSLRTITRLFKMKGFGKSLMNTLKAGFLTSVFSTATGFTVSVLFRYKRRKSPVLNTLTMLPMAVSSVVTGLGLTYLVKDGNFLTLVLSETFMYWPFAFRQLYPSLCRIKDSTLESSLLLSDSKVLTVFDIMIPYSKKSLLSSMGFCFAMSAGDSTVPLLLALKDFDTLSLFTYRLASSYRTNLSSASGLVLCLICMAFFKAADTLKETK